MRIPDTNSLTHDRYVREITFGDDWIRIRDRIHCRFPCEAVICQSPSHQADGPLGSAGPSSGAGRPPIFTAGGKHVEITRVYRDGALCDEHP